MMIRDAVLIAAVALVMGGCGKDGPVTVLASPATAPHVAPECLSGDAAWTELPDADVTQSELARLWRKNRASYRRVVATRQVCRASLVAQIKAVK